MRRILRLRNLATALAIVMPLAMGRPVQAVTGLQTGDIAITTFNSDPSAPGTEYFAFVPFVDLGVGTTIYFTDNEWTGTTLNAGEGYISWTATSPVSKGTVVSIGNPGSGSAAITSTGAAFRPFGGFDLSSGGDQIIAFQGLPNVDPAGPKFLFAINTAGAGGFAGPPTNAVPAGLTEGVNALSVGSFPTPGSDEDNGQYTGTRTGTTAALKSAIADMQNNWTFTDGAGDQSIVVDATAFTILGPPGPAPNTFIKGTSFEEPTAAAPGVTSSDANTADHALTNAGTGVTVEYTSVGGELGFGSFYSNDLGADGVNGDFLGVQSVVGNPGLAVLLPGGVFPDGNQGYEIADPDGTVTVTLDQVDLSGLVASNVLVDMKVANTNFEDGDFIRVFVEGESGQRIELFAAEGDSGSSDPLDTLGGLGQFITLSADLTGWTKATLKFQAASNANDEIAFFDNVRFNGQLPVPEPATAGLVMLAGLALLRRRR
jgi:hypothetical protein